MKIGLLAIVILAVINFMPAVNLDLDLDINPGRIPAVKSYHQTRASIYELASFLNIGKQGLSNELRSFISRNLSVPATEPYQPAAITQYITKETPVLNITHTTIRESISDSQLQELRAVLASDSDLSDIKKTLEDLRSEFSSFQRITPTTFQLPPTNTKGIGPITLNPDKLTSSTLTVSGGSTLNSLTVDTTLSVTQDLTIDTNVFKVDSTNNRVGIGTASPETTFEVVGTASISGATTLNNLTYTWPSTQTANKFLQTNGSGTLSWATAGVSSNSLDFDEFVDTMTLDSNLTINRGTNNYFIGIGQTPSTVFEVQGTASASYLLTGNTLQVGGYASAAYSRFGTGTTTHTGTISDTDDLLISGGFEVNGSAAFDGLALFTRGASFSGNLTPTSDALFDLGASSSNNKFRWRNGFFSNQVLVGSTSTITTSSLSNDSALFEIENRGNNPIKFSTNLSERMRIAADGNVGIGTTSPAQKLHLVGTSLSSTASTSTALIEDTNARLHLFSANTGKSMILFGRPADNDEGSIVYDNNNSSLSFFVNQSPGGGQGSAKMVISGGGNVGIGTTGPATKLDIVGGGVALPATSGSTQSAGHITRFSGNDNAIIDMGSNGGSGMWIQSTDKSNLASNYKLLLNPNGGNVGIGTTNPTTKLQIVGGNCSDDAGGGGCTADFAEIYPSSEDLEKGDVVMVDSLASVSYSVKRSDGQGVAIGIVSTAPAAIADSGNLRLMANEYVLDPRNPAVALAGRTPVKVTDENGLIKVGDRLTASKTKPGYAMKQTEAGQSIGIALEGLNGEATSASDVKKVLMFVNLGYWVPSVADLSEPSVSGSTVNSNLIFNAVITMFKDAFNIVFENGLVKVANIITDKITAKEICLEEVCVNKAQLKELLEKNGLIATPTPTPEINLIDLISNSPNETPIPNDPIINTASSSEETIIEPTPSPSESPTPTPSPEVSMTETEQPTSESTPVTEPENSE